MAITLAGLGHGRSFLTVERGAVTARQIPPVGWRLLQNVLHQTHHTRLVGRKIKGILPVPEALTPGILEHGQKNVANLGVAHPVHDAHKGKAIAGRAKVWRASRSWWASTMEGMRMWASSYTVRPAEQMARSAPSIMRLMTLRPR